MKNVIVHTRLDINLTATDWRLYTTIAGVEKAAYALSKDIQVVLNDAPNIELARQGAYKVLAGYRQYGSYDTEPRMVLESLISLRFPLHTR
jgi:hypothetical protein